VLDISAQHEDNRAVMAGQTVSLPVGFGMVAGRSNRRIPLTVVRTCA
jgi:hypothetical protein